MSNNTYSSAIEACVNAQQFFSGTATSSYSPKNGYAVGGSCASAGSTFVPPNNIGYTCDGKNVWADANFNIGGNNWDSKTVQDACNACNGSFTASTPEYVEIGSCDNIGSFSYDVASDGNRWFYTLFGEGAGGGNLNPLAACQMAKNVGPTLPAGLNKKKPTGSCKALGSERPVFNYGSPGGSGSESGSAIAAMIGSAIEPYTYFDKNDNKKLQKMILLGVLVIAVIIVLYFLLKKEEKEMQFFFY
jgi:hypothetical protein